MKPFMDDKGIMAASDQKAIAKFMMKRFNETIRPLATGSNGFILVRTPGTLAANEWTNEIHATRDGFGKIAAKIADAMRPHL
jgi:hypothetical protein